jgi:hypothetical protein
MPRFTVELSESAVTRLQVVVEVYNQNNGLSLTVQDWITLHLRELAVQDQLAASERTLRQQAEQTHAAAVAAERQRLLESVG